MSTPGDSHGQQQWGPPEQQQWGSPTQAGPPPAQKPRNGMGTAALVLGILAILTCWLPVVGFVLGLVAIILGAIGRSRAKKLQATNGGVALAGLILGVLSVIVNILVSVLLGAGIFAFLQAGGGQSLQQFQQCLTDAQNAGSPAGVQQAFQQCQAQLESQLPSGGEPGGGG